MNCGPQGRQHEQPAVSTSDRAAAVETRLQTLDKVARVVGEG